MTVDIGKMFTIYYLQYAMLLFDIFYHTFELCVYKILKNMAFVIITVSLIFFFSSIFFRSNERETTEHLNWVYDEYEHQIKRKLTPEIDKTKTVLNKSA